MMNTHRHIELHWRCYGTWLPATSWALLQSQRVTELECRPPGRHPGLFCVAHCACPHPSHSLILPPASLGKGLQRQVPPTHTPISGDILPASRLSFSHIYNVSNQPPYPTTAWNFVLNQILVPIHTLSKCYPLLCFFYFSFLIYDMWGGEGRERDRKRERRALIHC